MAVTRKPKTDKKQDATMGYSKGGKAPFGGKRANPFAKKGKGGSKAPPFGKASKNIFGK